MDRSRKREDGDEQPADKRACSSSEFRSSCSSSPASSSSPPPPPPPPLAGQPATADCDMETSSSSARSSERGAGESAYGSCGSHDDSDREHDEDDDDGMEDDGNPSECPVSRTRLQRVFGSLQEDGAGGSVQLAALTELCEVLSFCTEDALGYFPLDTIVPVLVRLAENESNPDVMLLAIRALTYLCDAMPRSSDAIVRHGTLRVLCGRLLAIEYMDVAEQSLQALEKISRKQQVPCLQAGTINAVLSFIDFFSTTLQRVAVSTVANVCKKLPLDCSSIVMESIPTLCTLLQYEDQKLVEIVATCLIRIADSFSRSSAFLDELCKHGVIQKSLDLITNENRMSLSRTTYAGLISLLTKLTTSSSVAVKTLFELHVSSTLRDILMAMDLSHGTPYSSFEDSYSNQVHEVLKLINQLVPPAARDMQDVQLVLEKEKILTDHPNFLHQFSVDVLPATIQVVNSGANTFICYGCVSIIQSIAYFSTSNMLLDLIKNINIPSFLAGMLARKDHHILNSTLKTIEILMQKLPGVFLNSFIKEGVIYAVDILSTQEKCLDSVSEQSCEVHNSENQTAARNISRCLCYLFDSPSSSSSESKTCRLRKDSICILARHIKTTYFNHEVVNAEIGLTEILQKLRTFCSVLNDNVDRCSTTDGFLQNEDYLTHILDQVMKELHGGEAMSTFEFIESGIVGSLAHYLSNGKYLLGTSSDCTSSNHFLAVLKRLQKFACICLSEQHQSWENMLLTLLLQKLQNALSSLDNFPVILSHSFKPRNSYADIPVRHSTTNPCLRVHFLRDKEENNLSDCDAVVNVDISSSLDAIEGYLWAKVSKGKNECHSGSAGDTTSSSKYASERDSSDARADIMQERAFAGSVEGISGQEQQTSVADSSDHVGVSTPTALADGEIVAKLQSSSPGGSKSKLTFYLGGKQLNRSMTLYQAILQDQISSESDTVIGPKLWNELYEITYQGTVEQGLMDCQMKCDNFWPSFCWSDFGFLWHKLPFFSSVLFAELPCKLDKLNPTYDILFMLKVLEGLNRFSFHLLSDERINAFAEGKINNFDDLKLIISSVPQAEFISSKLTDKLEQQLRDPLVLSSCSMPIWCSQLMSSCPFLFSFETKWKYFILTSFGSSKIQQYYIQHSNSDNNTAASERRLQSGSVTPRKKFKVNRGNILVSAVKMMELHAQSKSVVEVEYIEEVGTGLGPTLEFYTLVSREVQKVGLGMWRGDLSLNAGTPEEVGGSGYVSAPCGLFPRPWSSTTSALNGVEFAEVIKLFVLLGKLVAKAIKDRRILDIPFSRAFYKIILDQELGIYDIQTFDPELGRTLLEFHAITKRRKVLQSVAAENSKGPLDLNYRNVRIEDLCLGFILPGYSDYLLASESFSNMVNIANLEEYVALVVDATINSGISRQVEAFKSGFNKVFPLKNLQVFTEGELERLLCGEQDTWNFSELVDHIKFDHGYTASSPTVIYFLEVIQEFEYDQRRAFLQFVTGAPRLPPGGLAALNPKLTVVRKHCSRDADMDLPSVMTCANYLKLPPYTCKEKMKERLLYAINEGQGSFHLS